jgi:hypothetical protein
MASSCDKCIKAPHPNNKCFNEVRKKINDAFGKLQRNVKRTFKGSDRNFERRWGKLCMSCRKVSAKLRLEVISIQKLYWCNPRCTLLDTLADRPFDDEVEKHAEIQYDKECILLHEEQNLLLKPLTDFWQKVCDAHDHVVVTTRKDSTTSSAEVVVATKTTSKSVPFIYCTDHSDVAAGVYIPT